MSSVALDSFGHGFSWNASFFMKLKTWWSRYGTFNNAHVYSFHCFPKLPGFSNHSCSWHRRWIICAAVSSGIYYPHYTCCLHREIKKRLLSSQAMWLRCIQSSMARPGGCVLLSGRFARFYKVIILIAPFLRKASQVLPQLQMTPAPVQRWKRKNEMIGTTDGFLSLIPKFVVHLSCQSGHAKMSFWTKGLAEIRLKI